MLGRRVSSQAKVYKELMIIADERVRERDLAIKGKIHVSIQSPRQLTTTSDRKLHRTTVSNGSWTHHRSKIHGQHKE
jgi:hypothetical protein